jgi:hypothetical protein
MKLRGHPGTGMTDEEYEAMCEANEACMIRELNQIAQREYEEACWERGEDAWQNHC